MSRLYSKRLLLPFIGVIQIAELGRARALSLDGKNWSIRYAQHENEQTRNGPFRDDPRVNCSLVVTIEGDRLGARAINPLLDPEQVSLDSQRLFEVIHEVPIPFEAADRYEYWLLDGEDGHPLALLRSCVDAEEMERPLPPLQWRAMSAAQLAVRDPIPPEQGIHLPPVNDRLASRVEARAGRKPRAAWFERTEPATDGFPPYLLREDWQDEEGQRLCELYLRRLAPRLLMMSGLTQSNRRWLEQSAREYALDVERFYPLYPEVVDQGLLNAARVEARLRRAAQD
jgi:hypothetical protein